MSGAFRRRNPAVARLAAEWAAAVGPALARATTPRRLQGGTLTVACDGPMALELQHLAPALIERLNVYLGATVVQRLRLVQDGGLPGAAIAAARPPAPARPAVFAEAARRVTTLPAGPLREALARLGAAVLGERS